MQIPWTKTLATWLLAALPASSQILLQQLDGAAAGDEFGHNVACVGDTNDDGWPDFAIGALYDDNNGLENSGSVQLISGKDWSVLHMWDGLAAGDQFGNDVRSAGDVNQDGYTDIIVGANQFDGFVGGGDLVILINNLGGAGDWVTADFNLDGFVGGGDLVILINHLGMSASSVPASTQVVPEPGTLGILALGCFILPRRPRSRS